MALPDRERRRIFPPAPLVGVLAVLGTVVAAGVTVAAAGDSSRATVASDGVIEVPSEVEA